LMCHDIFFLSGQCMYSDYVWFGVNSIFFPPFISLFSTSICILSMNKIITTLQFFSLEVFFIFFEFQLFYLIKSLQIGKKKIIFILLQFLISRIEFLLFWFFIGMVYEFYLFLAILSSFFFFFMFASHSFYCYFFSNTILQN
jgi:hypothetical protein